MNQSFITNQLSQSILSPISSINHSQIHRPTVPKNFRFRTQQKDILNNIEQRKILRQKIAQNFKQQEKMQIVTEPQNLIVGLVNKNNKILIGRDFSKRKYCSSLQMCRLNTTYYDQLKKQIIENTKQKQATHRKYNKTLYGQVPLHLVVKGNQKGKQKNKQNHFKSARYMEMTAVEFLGEGIGNKMIRRFDQLRKGQIRGTSLTN